MKAPTPGFAKPVAEGIRCILARNPSPMTHWGTNSFILGEGEVAIVDPGPEDDVHLDALLTAVRGQRVSGILVTHPHIDHSPMARRLAQVTDAPVVGFGPATAGRSAVMQGLAETGYAGGGEGVDAGFAPDICLGDNESFAIGGAKITALHTPGHFAGHLAFRFGDALVSGDHVMDWASSLISPPDGDLRAFMATSERLISLDLPLFLPAHGSPITDPVERLTWLMNHRRTRGQAILGALTQTPQTLEEITQLAYSDVAPQMLAAAARNAFAHLIEFVEEKKVLAEPLLAHSAHFRLA